MHNTRSKHADRIPLLMLVYTCASLLHFVHNATYLHAYPNLPPTLTALGVYAAWCAVAAVGALGYWMYRCTHRPVHRRIHRIVGLVLIGLYAVLGFAGLDHYVVAPVSAHSWAMNLTIALEVATAAVLLIAALMMMKRSATALRS